MSLLPLPVSQVSRPNNHLMNDNSSPSTISPHQPDGFYAQPSPPSPNTDQQDDSPGSAAGSVGRLEKKYRKFSCQYCGRKFLRAEHLRRHEITRTSLLSEYRLIVDTGDKPFRCPYCKEAFSRRFVILIT